MERQRFDEYAKARRAPLTSYFRRRGVAPDDLEDLVQESYLLYWKRWESVQAGKDANFLYGIARNVLQVYWRELKRRKGVIGDGVLEGNIAAIPENGEAGPQCMGLLAQEEAEGMRRILAQLPERQRAVLQFMYFDGRTLTQTAEFLNVRTQTVHTHQRALARLTEFLAAEDDTGP